MTVQHMIETFLAQYPATTSAVSAIATVSAVIAALSLARKQSRPRLKVFADINVYISSESQIDSSNLELEKAPRMIGVTINNVGSVAVSIFVLEFPSSGVFSGAGNGPCKILLSQIFVVSP